MARMVRCKKLGRELPGLDAPPFAGDLGQLIYEQISAEAFALWQEHAKTLISAYQLNLADRAGRDFLRQQMEDYFFGEQAQMPDWFAQGAPFVGGKGAAKKGAAPRK